jgi:hypothetical protein
MFDGDIQLAAVTAAVPADHSRAARELGKRLAALAELDYSELRVEWRRLYRAHPPKKMSRDLLELGVAWKLQEKALGGFGASLKRRLADLAQTMATRGDLVKARAVTLRPGARLVRQWHGETHEIVVLEDGYCWRGELALLVGHRPCHHRHAMVRAALLRIEQSREAGAPPRRCCAEPSG